MPTVSIKIEGLDKLKSALVHSPKIVEEEINVGIKKSVISLERKAKQLAPVDSGRLRASHRTTFSNMRGELFPTTTYAAAVHQGSKAHFPPTGTPGVGNWAKKHGINAYALAKSMSKKGTRAQPWLSNTAEQETRNVERIMSEAVQRALTRIFK